MEDYGSKIEPLIEIEDLTCDGIADWSGVVGCVYAGDKSLAGDGCRRVDADGIARGEQSTEGRLVWSEVSSMERSASGEQRK